MKLIGISYLFPHFADGKRSVQKQMLGFMDTDIRKIFQRSGTHVFVEQFCQVGGTEPQTEESSEKSTSSM